MYYDCIIPYLYELETSLTILDCMVQHDSYPTECRFSTLSDHSYFFCEPGIRLDRKLFELEIFLEST